MKRAGCRELLVGFESASQQLLQSMHKNLILEKSYEFMRLARQARLDVHGCFVIGLPGETDQSAQATIDFALKLGLTTVQFSGAVPFPGTEFYKSLPEKRMVEGPKWSDWLAKGEQIGVVEYPQMSAER